MRRDCDATLSPGLSVVASSAFEQLCHYVSAQPSPQPRHCWRQSGRAAASPSGEKESDAAADQMRRACRRFYQRSAVAGIEARERRRRRDGGGCDGWPERAPTVASWSASPFARDQAFYASAATSVKYAKFTSDDYEATAMRETLRAECRRALRACAAHSAVAGAVAAAGRLSNPISLPPIGRRKQTAAGVAPVAGSLKPAATVDGIVKSQLSRGRWQQQSSPGDDRFGTVLGRAAPLATESESCYVTGVDCGLSALTRSRSISSSADSGIKSRDSVDDAAPRLVAMDRGGTPAYSKPIRTPFNGTCEAPPPHPLSKLPSVDVEAKNLYVIPSPFGKEHTSSAASVTKNEPQVVQPRNSSGLNEEHAGVSAVDHVCCSACGRTQASQGAPLCAYYRTCRGCGALYCSRACRRSAWAAHKKQCGYSSAVSRVKRVLRQLLTDEAMRRALSDFAVSGYIRQGRGVVFLPLGPVDESWCFEDAWSAAWSRRFYVRNSALQLLPEGVVAAHSSALLSKCTKYDPQTHFVLLSTARFWISDRPKCGSDSGLRVEEYDKLMVLQVRRKQDTEVLLQQQQTCSSGGETLVVSPTCSSYDATLFGRRARQLFLMNVQTALRRRGVSLRLQYPELYSDLCRYVDRGGDVTPMSLFAADRSGRRFMCCILPPPKSYAA